MPIFPFAGYVKVNFAVLELSRYGAVFRIMDHRMIDAVEF